MPQDPSESLPRLDLQFRTELLTSREAQMLGFFVTALFETQMNAHGWAHRKAADASVAIDIAARMTELLQRIFPDLDAKLTPHYDA